MKKRRKRTNQAGRATRAKTGKRFAALQESAAEDLKNGRIVFALEKLDKVICGGSPDFGTWSLAGTALNSVCEYSQAIDAWNHALLFSPEQEMALFGMATAKYQMGDVSAAVGLFLKIVEMHGSLNALCNLAVIIPGDPASSQLDILNIRKQFAERLSKDFAEIGDNSSPQKAKALGSLRNSERIRIGYVSAFFPRTNYMRPVWSLINHHNVDQFEVHLLADFATSSEFGWLEPGTAAKIHITTSLTNNELVKFIQDLCLDVVIDLNGYSIPDRLSIYCSRLAPVVAAWFNMYGTSGLPGIDFLIGDQWVLKKDDDAIFSEQLVRLPVSYLSFGKSFDSPLVSNAPCSHLEPEMDGQFAFGSLVSQYKITGDVLDAWSEILHGAPKARLLLGNRTLGSPCNRDYVLASFAERGIEAQRLSFLPPASHFSFLEHYNQFDLALDSFPYNGGTTTTEALWQGVPVICFDGDRWAARTSKTLLANCRLDAFIATSRQEYIQTAIRFATDPSAQSRLIDLRHSLREQLKKSPVCDSKKLAVEFERSILELHFR